ncbi:MAG: hypothetical protein WC618_03665 [Patescibacteria group bacterium]
MVRTVVAPIRAGLAHRHLAVKRRASLQRVMPAEHPPAGIHSEQTGIVGQLDLLLGSCCTRDAE